MERNGNGPDPMQTSERETAANELQHGGASEHSYDGAVHTQNLMPRHESEKDSTWIFISGNQFNNTMSVAS